jgi:hypothetical protein
VSCTPPPVTPSSNCAVAAERVHADVALRCPRDRVPALASPTPRDVIWAQEILSVGSYNSNYFLVPKNSFSESEFRVVSDSHNSGADYHFR